MSRFTQAQREGIFAEARANLQREPNQREPIERRQSVEGLIYKTHNNDDDAPAERVASGSELAWWQWVDARLDARLEVHSEAVGEAIGEYCGQQVAALKRELECLRRELTVQREERCVDARLDATVEGVGAAVGEFHEQALREVAVLKRELDQLRQEVTALREQVGLERGLRDLRSEVEEARAQVPNVPEIAARLEAGQARLRREVAATKSKVDRVRVDQSITDWRLAELRKATEARAMKSRRLFQLSRCAIFIPMQARRCATSRPQRSRPLRRSLKQSGCLIRAHTMDDDRWAAIDARIEAHFARERRIMAQALGEELARQLNDEHRETMRAHRDEIYALKLEVVKLATETATLREALADARARAAGVDPTIRRVN